MDKSKYDGSDKKNDGNSTNGNETGGNTSSDSAPAQESKPSRRKETASRAGKSKLKVNKVVVHEVDEYYTFSEGGRFMNRNDVPSVWEYRVIEHVRVHNVEHVYKVARVKLADGAFTSTMEHPLKNFGSIFSPKLPSPACFA